MNTSSRCYICHSPLGTCDIDGLCSRCRYKTTNNSSLNNDINVHVTYKEKQPEENKSDNDIEKLAIDFEKKHGTHLFLKASISVLNKVLVEKGMITKQEIQEEFVKISKELTQEKENN